MMSKNNLSAFFSIFLISLTVCSLVIAVLFVMGVWMNVGQAFCFAIAGSMCFAVMEIISGSWRKVR